MSHCTILLNSCLEENNISIYLFAIEVADIFLQKALNTEVVLGSLQSLIKAIVLRTTDTNTRVRKKSVDLINHLWNSSLLSTHNPGSRLDENLEVVKKDSISVLLADVICD